MKYTAQLVIDAKAAHGEGVFYDYRAGRLLWLDCMGGKLHMLDDATRAHTVHALPFLPMTVVPHERGGFAFASPTEFLYVSEDLQEQKVLQSFVHKEATGRFNDGKCDPAGRFLVGSMSTEGSADAGVLYQMDLDGRTRELLSPVGISNGLVWVSSRPFGKDEVGGSCIMYYTDTVFGKIEAFDYDLATGDIANRRTALQIDGQPDGMAIDADGNVWFAQWEGFRAVCFDPATGEILHTVELPVPNVTAVAFAGADRKTLYITTSRLGMSEEDLIKYPLSGGLFAAEVHSAGADMVYCNVKV